MNARGALKRVLVALSGSACVFSALFAPGQATGAQEKATMQLTSSAFSEGQPIAEKNTCDGKNVSPPLQWSGVPPGTKSLALIADDPDAPGGVWVHWVFYDLPPTVKALPE